MIITWHGLYTIKLVTPSVTIVLDPHGADDNLIAFRGKADVIALSSSGIPEMSHISGIQGEPILIDKPGEYAFQEITLYSRGWFDPANQEHSIFRWIIEGISVLHLGALNRPLTSDERQALEKDEIDILLISVGGGSGFDTKMAHDLTTTIEPRVVIPINFKTTKSQSDLDTVEQFAKEMGVDPKQTQDKFTVSVTKLPQDGLQTIILQS